MKAAAQPLMNQQKIIELKNVSIHRGGQLVLNGVNWSTSAGQHWFILGGNGSGKTTLLEILMGYLWPQKGAVSVLGQRYGRANLPELRRRIGYVSSWIFERMQLFYPVRDVVASGLEASVRYGGDEKKGLNQKIRNVLADFSGLEILEKRFGELSSGEQFKVILSRALIHQPALLILDEPFSYLDIGARQKAYRLLEGLVKKEDAPQIVLVTHHLEDILPFYTHGAMMHEGRIIKKGLKENILRPEIFKKVFNSD
jgi:iron complex transport system ATP-binding protein